MDWHFPAMSNQMRAEIIKLRQKINTTFIYVTHDQTEAMTLDDRIVIMKDGFIQQNATPQEVFNHPYALLCGRQEMKADLAIILLIFSDGRSKEIQAD